MHASFILVPPNFRLLPLCLGLSLLLLPSLHLVFPSSCHNFLPTIQAVHADGETVVPPSQTALPQLLCAQDKLLAAPISVMLTHIQQLQSSIGTIVVPLFHRKRTSQILPLAENATQGMIIIKKQMPTTETM